jgi:hypothetical protein
MLVAESSNIKSPLKTAMDAVDKELGSEHVNEQLKRMVCAQELVRFVMNQKGEVEPSLLSIWTEREICRLLEDLRFESSITFRVPFMGNGFKHGFEDKQLNAPPATEKTKSD